MSATERDGVRAASSPEPGVAPPCEPGPGPPGSAAVAAPAEVLVPAHRPKKSALPGTIAKIVVAAGVIAFLIHRGAIDPKRVALALADPWWCGRQLLLVFAAITIITIRWLLLLRIEQIEISLPDALKLTLVGHFWNNVLPGSVTGDVVKMYYVGKKYPDKNAEAYATVMIDRVVGLAALVYLSFASALANLPFIFAPGHERLRWTFAGNAAAALAFTVGILALVLGIGRKSTFADYVRGARWGFVAPLRRGYRSLIRLGERPRVLLASFALGILSHGLLVIIAMSSGHVLGEHSLSVSSYAFVVPVGLFVNSLPFGLPGGIGVGEAAFDQLFSWAGGRNDAGACVGADVMVLTRLAQLAWGLVGAVIYAFDRKALAPSDDAPPSDATPCEEKGKVPSAS